MGVRGRKSSAELAVVPQERTEIVRRPEVPPELSDAEAQHWLVFVNSMPADYFSPETQGMLAQLCRHLATANRVASLKMAAEEAENVDVAEYDRILRMQERESRCISMLETKMRLSQQTRYDKQSKVSKTGKRPWTN
jgi:hypothetical protein